MPDGLFFSGELQETREAMSSIKFNRSRIFFYKNKQLNDIDYSMYLVLVQTLYILYEKASKPILIYKIATLLISTS